HVRPVAGRTWPRRPGRRIGRALACSGAAGRGRRRRCHLSVLSRRGGPGADRCYILGRRCSTTTRSVPEPGPLLVPEGCPVSYGCCGVGQPTKFWLLYSNHSEAVVVGMMGRFAATYFAIGASAAAWSATVAAPAR